jgi:hypothetical protein
MVYKVMFYGGISISIIMLIISVILFFKLDVIKVVNDLTGVTAKRKIQEIKEQNINYGQKKYVPMETGGKKGEVTGKLNLSEKLRWKSKTDKLMKKAKLEEVVIEKDIESKDSLTTILKEDTSVLGSYGSETELLQEIEDINSTDIVTEKDFISNEFEIIFDVLSIHTDEVI